MITYLHLEHFVKHTDKEFVFNKGLTAISGKNGGGKSLIQEAIRFALFGTQALRGKLENYDKALKVTARFIIGGKQYEIVRTLKDCQFGSIVGTTACNKESKNCILGTTACNKESKNCILGTTACNKAIEETLGFGMNVFDMGCCAKQFEITRLGDMKPTERKTAVDKLIGLDTLELLRKDVKQTLSELRARKDGMEKYLTEPTEPIKPENYKPSEEIRAELDKANFIKQKLGEKVAVWSTLPTTAPVKPLELDLTPPLGSYEDATKKQLYEEKIKSATVREEPVDVREGYKAELARISAWENFTDLKEPKFTKEELKKLKLDWENYNAYQSAKKVTCPKCGEEFAISGIKPVEKPITPFEELNDQEVILFKWEHRPVIEKPSTGMSKDELMGKITQCEKDLAKYNEYLEAKTGLDMLGPCADLQEWNDYNCKMAKYTMEKQVYENELSRYNRGKELLGEITDLTAKSKQYDIEGLKTLEKVCTEYETEFRIYGGQLERYQQVRKELDEIEKELEGYQKADEGLVSLKSKIKLYVIPSLQKVATNLVSEMTDGELNSVTINEEFEICVNGKELNLLSGSEKAVANLAIRLGLGCVLTHKIFNVFLGDEIDESMSEERAGMVAKSLHKLLGQIDQIILISHKDIEADNYIKIA